MAKLCIESKHLFFCFAKLEFDSTSLLLKGTTCLLRPGHFTALKWKLSCEFFSVGKCELAPQATFQKWHPKSLTWMTSTFINDTLKKTGKLEERSVMKEKCEL